MCNKDEQTDGANSRNVTHLFKTSRKSRNSVQDIEQKPYERHFFQLIHYYKFKFNIFILYEKPKNLNQRNFEGYF